ncbi:hypothetical protein [Amycolatopsis viridis]|uniref:Uncharacterized protein n=1 Tax=Amycolatopsis viridis TaxID=185678 RepID=A0ABX0SU85_9PSEU|nr:hypothetical protein [Amycolatopsis viridis]NIH80128.1 hypothetical protein [Amycolatopsis viridis]
MKYLVLRMRGIALLWVMALFAGMPVAHAMEYRPAAFETFAGISCLSGAYPHISYKGWGVDYAKNTKIDIYLDVTGPSTASVKPLVMTSLYTDGNGAWSSPTYSDLSSGVGTYHLHVRAYSTSSGALLNEAFGACTY